MTESRRLYALRKQLTAEKEMMQSFRDDCDYHRNMHELRKRQIKETTDYISDLEQSIKELEENERAKNGVN